MAEPIPTKSNISDVFQKLRAIATNKVCFDCSSKNPTWSSVTYGIFICMDCSAVHRSLGVHLSFVRSTQLDTNWTWQQLRQMQLGGNAAASVFFRQHNCVTTDAQQKYTSRAAQLYKEKLAQAATNAMRIHGTDLHIEAHHEKHEDLTKDADFFEEHSSFNSLIDNSASTAAFTPVPKAASLEKGTTLNNVNKGPAVDLSNTVQSAGERKSIIGGRKPAAKKTGLGGKKAGLGAQRVQTNFADLEKQAEMLDQRKEKSVEEPKPSAEEEQEQIVSMRLAYQDLSMEQNKEAERVKRSDPKKAEQVERLGMGFAVKSGISHSAISDMKTIEQETPVKSTSSKSAYDSDTGDEFFDDYSLKAFNFSMIRNSPKLDDVVSFVVESSSTSGRDRFSSKEDKSAEKMSSSKSWYDGLAQESRPRSDPIPPSASFSNNGEAQKKFGNAKAISSDQFFGQNNEPSYEQKANLARFEGSTSISSSDYFHDGRSNNASSRPGYTSGITSSISAPDLDDVKESVRQGVTKVAGRLSSMANGVINSIQEKYGY